MKQNNKRKILRIQPRLVITLLIVLLQIALITYLSEFVRGYLFPIYNISVLLAIITVAHILNTTKNPSYKIAWIIIIMTFPFAGVIIFMICGGGRVFPHLKKKMDVAEKRYKSLLTHKDTVVQRLKYEDLIHSRQATYLEKESGYPLYSDTKSTYFSNGEEFFRDFFETLKTAEKYIYIEYFIIAEGELWEKTEEILSKKAKNGLEIKIIFDDFGSIRRQDKNFIKHLNSLGISAVAFNPIKPTSNFFMNNRDHRKITVIDGNIAYTGGVNIADEYANIEKCYGHWLDCAIKLEGKAVDSFVAMFCAMWEFNTGEVIDMSRHLLSSPSDENDFVLPYCDGPTTDKTPAEGIYMQILDSAQRYVYIMTPYLILDSSMVETLTLAAKSGVDVKIIVPHIPDKKYVHPVTQYNYTNLLKSGIEIYEYTPGFIHSKIFVSDDRVATVGSVNMDYRSFVLHFECGVWLCQSASVADIRDSFTETLKLSEKIEYKDWKKRSFFKKMIEWLLNIFAPFM